VDIVIKLDYLRSWTQCSNLKRHSQKSIWKSWMPLEVDSVLNLLEVDSDSVLKLEVIDSVVKLGVVDSRWTSLFRNCNCAVSRSWVVELEIFVVLLKNDESIRPSGSDLKTRYRYGDRGRGRRRNTLKKRPVNRVNRKRNQ
jgi:hypothetical protein